MANVRLESSTRTVRGKQVKKLRSEGLVPAVLFGARVEATPIQVQERELSRTLREAGATALIDLVIDGGREAHVVLARDIQRDILTGHLQHVDFYQVQLDRKVRTSPAIHIVGEAPAVHDEGAILVQVLNNVEIEALPGDLIDAIDVDVSGLKTLADNITIADLPLPSGVTILADPTEVVIAVVQPRAAIEEEIAEAEAAAEALVDREEVEEVEPEEAE